jgi:hypothetical protein
MYKINLILAVVYQNFYLRYTTIYKKTLFIKVIGVVLQLSDSAKKSI